MLSKILSKILGDPNEKEIKRIEKIVEKINAFEEEYQKLSEQELKAKTEEFKNRVKNGESLDDLLPESFAVTKNACRRLMGTKAKVGKLEIEWDMIPFDVQLVGGVVLHEGKIAEMKTGEGKTLVAVLSVYLNALTEKGCHVITVNDYLAKRDSAWMGHLYNYLGLTVGCIVHDIDPAGRKEAYNCDITYGTNNEFGFDYLRDNMATSLADCVQRGLHYAIVDEVDSILIDEARTPLIISSPTAESTDKYMQYSHHVKHLNEGQHYEIDEKAKTAILSEEGVKKMEEILNVENIYTDSGFQEVHHIEQALRAEAIYKKDVDYVVKDDQVIIVDEFTGRLMPGRRYSEGLHQAIEAKEGVEVKRESRTLATITFQNYFRLFEKLAGMTGTAVTEAEEFAKIYSLDTLVIPTHLPIVREDRPDAIYKTEKGKFIAIARTVKELYEKGQPVLIGTVSIEKSELLSKMLKREDVPHSVLNAKYHEKEAEIIAKAGLKKAVTIATNMAGRGTDIKLGEGRQEVGGLAVIGSERHESRRIDNQLRGRSGRQGDPGMSQFYISLEDSLMRLFGSDRVKKMMDFLKIPEDMPIENKMISKSIESAQKKVEGHHFDIRKHLVEYDDVMNKHREIIYAKRRQVLEWENKEGEADVQQKIKEAILKLIEKIIKDLVHNYTDNIDPEQWNYKEIIRDIQAIHKSSDDPISEEKVISYITPNDLSDFLTGHLVSEYEKKENEIEVKAVLREAERRVYLRTIDMLWMEHIDSMHQLRESVSFRGYAQRDPLLEYQGESFQMFKRLLQNIERNTVNTLFKLQVRIEAAPPGIQPMRNLRTNEDEIEGQLRESDMEMKPKTVKADSIGERKAANVGRNEPCPCSSGKKYKKCCGKNL